MTHGLLSCRVLDSRGLFTQFGNNMCKITHADGTLVAESLEGANRLYPLRLAPSSPSSNDSVAALAMTPSFDLLHKRLAHPGKDALQMMIRKDLAGGLTDIPDDAKDFDCLACIKGKMVRGRFQDGHDTATKHLGCLHSNVCGPMDVPSLGKNHYFCILVDDRTRYLWFLPCAKKSDFTGWFTHLDALFANHYRTHMKIL